MTAGPGIVVVEITAHDAAGKGSRLSRRSLRVTENPPLPTLGYGPFRQGQCDSYGLTRARTQGTSQGIDHSLLDCIDQRWVEIAVRLSRRKAADFGGECV